MERVQHQEDQDQPRQHRANTKQVGVDSMPFVRCEQLSISEILRCLSRVYGTANDGKALPFMRHC